MNMFTIITDDGSAVAVAENLIASGRRAVNVEAPLIRIYHDMMRVEDEVFRSQGRRGGGSWAKLADTTIASKGHDIILYESGALWESLTDENHEFQIFDIGVDSLEFGTSRPHAELHQSGRGGMKARPFLKFTPYDERRWAGWIGEHVVAPFTKDGGRASASN